MKRIIMIVVFAAVVCSCGSSNNKDENANSEDTNVVSTTPPANRDTNPIGVMMGDTSIGINDSLKKDSLKK